MPHDAVIHLIDDDAAVRHAVAFLLTASGYAVRVYESALDFVEALPKVQPGCVVTDVRMPGMDGLALQHTLQARHIGFPVIVMTGHGDVALAVEAMKAGAVDFIEKPFDDEILLAAIKLATERQQRDASHDAEIAAFNARIAALSARERDVLEGLARGQPNKIIAYDLGISARTVEVHRAKLMTKMAAGSLSELIRMIFAVRAASTERQDQSDPARLSDSS